MTIALNERVGVLERVARYQRKTNETAIEVRVNLDGAGVRLDSNRDWVPRSHVHGV